MKPLWPTSWDNPLGPAQDTHAQHKHGQDEHAHRPAWLVPRPRPVGSKTCGKLRMQTRSNLTHPLCLAPYEENQHEATTLPMNSASYAACCTLATPRCQLGAAQTRTRTTLLRQCRRLTERHSRTAGASLQPEPLGSAVLHSICLLEAGEGLPSPGARAQTAPC